ncbi:hypothetical protein Bbelb_034980 [Branchiostoma belcheri]|nr:hypothetical protein Bbelb_034980 [Branchiostoma belcheri]
MDSNRKQANEDEAYKLPDKQEVRQKENEPKPKNGAQGNVMPLQHYAKMFPEHNNKNGRVKEGILTPSDTILLTAYEGARIPHLGKALIQGKHKVRDVTCSFYIIKSEEPVILGLKACQQLNIMITINHEVKAQSHQNIDQNMPLKDRPPINSKKELMEMYPECFYDNVGCFKEEYHITIDPNVKQVVHPPRDRLKAQLEEMVEEGIISKVTQPTDWVNSIVVKEKSNGKLRIYLDPKDLNNALKQDRYATPTLEEITPHLSGAKIDEESSLLTTFNTPFGWYKFNRLPFGLKVSQDVFQREIDDAYRNCRGAIGIADDIQVYGEDDEAHDYNLHEAMEKTRAAGIKLNAEKCITKK